MPQSKELNDLVTLRPLVASSLCLGCYSLRPSGVVSIAEVLSDTCSYNVTAGQTNYLAAGR